MRDDYSYNRNVQSDYHNVKDWDSNASTVETSSAISFMNRVYFWMFGGLTVTALIAYGIATLSPEMITKYSGAFWACMIVELILVFTISAAIEKLSPLAAGALFVLYAALNGVTLSFVFLLYTSESIATTFLITAGTFAAMSIWGYITKKNLSTMGTFLFYALIGLIIASIVNIFLASSGLYWLLTFGGVIVFAGLTAYDVQRLRLMGENAEAFGSERVKKYAIVGALALYLDFINLFLYLLRLFGRRD